MLETALLDGNRDIAIARTRDPPSESRPYSRKVQRVILHLTRNFAQPVTLNELADVACCSPWHLDRIFGQTTGLTPMAFLGSMRLEMARTRVMTSEARIIEIAYDVGYNSLGSFGKRFTARVGLAPRLLRRAADRFDAKRFLALLEAASFHKPTRASNQFISIRGALTAPADSRNQHGFALVALFPDAVPTIYPVACAVARLPGPFALGQVPSGRYTLLALAFTDAASPEQLLLQTELPRARRAGLRLGTGRPLEIGDISLEMPGLEDPPIVPVFPLLFEQRA